jgi:Flp pilus assembly protein CpaB
MNRTRLIMIGALALAIAFLVSVIVYKNLQGKMGSSDPGVQVMVAANDLQVWSRLEERDIRIISVPSADLPP